MTLQNVPRVTCLLLVVLCVATAGCGGANDLTPFGATNAPAKQAAPFDGYWRKFDDSEVHFAKFNNGQCEIGDKRSSRSGSFTYVSTSDVEPLYKITAELPAGNQQFQLYFEEDTIDLIFENDKQRSGLYEITFNAP